MRGEFDRREMATWLSSFRIMFQRVGAAQAKRRLQKLIGEETGARERVRMCSGKGIYPIV